MSWSLVASIRSVAAGGSIASVASATDLSIGRLDPLVRIRRLAAVRRVGRVDPERQQH